jgi:hypothetical protein
MVVVVVVGFAVVVVVARLCVVGGFVLAVSALAPEAFCDVSTRA